MQSINTQMKTLAEELDFFGTILIKMNKIKKVMSVLIYSFSVLVPYKKYYAMPQPIQYTYHDISAGFHLDEIKIPFWVIGQLF